MEKRTIAIYGPGDSLVLCDSSSMDEPVFATSGDIWSKKPLGKVCTSERFFFQHALSEPKPRTLSEIWDCLESRKLEVRRAMNAKGTKSWVELNTEFGMTPLTDERHGFQTVREAVEFVLDMEEIADGE